MQQRRKQYLHNVYVPLLRIQPNNINVLGHLISVKQKKNVNGKMGKVDFQVAPVIRVT